ncbi:MAG: mercury methylation corrinoid protein HgcA [Clostridiales bacterium]|nr:mercury methylation corrinoid protein HgcA [Clostridiales bacterium]
MSQTCCSENSCCCSESTGQAVNISTSLTFRDHWGAFKVRWGVGRTNYRVEPGLYAVGGPDENSPVLVSANYKLTFDTLRKNLAGLDCWLLILDTKGVNVWCAAGKGTFGTDELIDRIQMTGLSEVVAHKRLILPQLGAVGVSAHEVTRRTGFSVLYGSVRADDIRAFIASGYEATKEMRTVKFTLRDRLVLTPVELAETLKPLLMIFGVLFLVNLFAAKPFGVYDFCVFVGTIIVGSVLTPALLPILPGRALSGKGWILGLVWTAAALWLFGWLMPVQWLAVIGYLLLFPAVAAYLAMNFTGCTPYTSPSGVLKEMKIALPFIIGSGVAGAVLILINHLVG